MSESQKILQQVSQFYGTDLFQKTHKREICFPRMVALYMLYVFTDWTLKEIGKVFDTDHSQVLAANKKVRTFCRYYPEIRKQVIEIESQLE